MSDFQHWELTELQRLLATSQAMLAGRQTDALSWELRNNKVFSVKSFYDKIHVRP